MRTDYKVGRCSRRCQQLQRPLRPGEWYYSVVSDDDDEGLTRIDIASEAWQGPPEGTVGWWKNRMPEAGARKLKPAPDALLIDLLRQSDNTHHQEASEPATWASDTTEDDFTNEGTCEDEAVVENEADCNLQDAFATDAPVPDNPVADADSAEVQPAEEDDDDQAPLRLDARLRYLLALMLLRRRALRTLDAPAENEEGMQLEVVADGTSLHVVPQSIPAHELQQLNEQLTELLFCESD